MKTTLLLSFTLIGASLPLRAIKAATRDGRRVRADLAGSPRRSGLAPMSDVKVKQPRSRALQASWPTFVTWVHGTRHLFVAPDGKPDAPGTDQAPLDLGSVLTKRGLVKPGDVVWVQGGRYETGSIRQDPGVCGTAERPIIIRALPGVRATVAGEIVIMGHHTWLWGLEITGPPHSGVELRRGDGVRLINLVLHDNGAAARPEKRKPTGHGIGGWNVGNDHEYYGNLIYHNGVGTLDHGIYAQNTAKHTTKKFIDNILFENAGCGFHLYGQRPALHGLHLEGNISFATSLHPKYSGRGQMNILVGGTKPIGSVVVKQNCTYHPQAKSKRGVDIGYTGKGGSHILVEDNYFMCGSNAMELKGIARDVTVRNNTFWSPRGMVRVTFGGEVDRSTIAWDGNTYVANGHFDLGAWRRKTGFDEHSKIVAGKNGRPAGLFVHKRVNRYEPSRVHLAVYNWDRKPAVRIDLQGILQAGDAYRVVNVLDYYGRPVASGKARGPFIELPMQGHRYEPEFGAYVLFRQEPTVR